LSVFEAREEIYSRSPVGVLGSEEQGVLVHSRRWDRSPGSQGLSLGPKSTDATLPEHKNRFSYQNL
jgi:hypothetical protein